VKQAVLISGLPSVSKLMFTVNGKWTLIFSLSGTTIVNNRNSPGTRGLFGAVAQEKIPERPAAIAKIAMDIGFRIILMPL